MKKTETSIPGMKVDNICEAGHYRTNAMMRAMISVRRTIAAPKVFEGVIPVGSGR
jgi:hypothetical protein